MHTLVIEEAGHRLERIGGGGALDQRPAERPAQVREGMAGLAIVDAHQHFWDPVANYHPWLRDEPPISFRYGDYRAIRRRYLPPDYRADVSPVRIDQTVYVETEWDPADPVGEMRYVERLRHEFGLPTVAVAHAQLDKPDARDVLAQHAAFTFVRSVRHKPRANRSPAESSPGGMADAQWRNGYAELGRNNLRFDLQTPWWHLAEATRLASDFPYIPILLNHTGLPADRGAERVAGWKAAMKTLASCPNVAVKISGLGQQGQPWTVAANRDIVLTTIDLFGPSRCMFASNFPVDSLCASFHTIFDGFREIVRDFSAGEQHGLFHDNAIRIYGMER